MTPPSINAKEFPVEPPPHFRPFLDGVKDYAIFLLDPAGRVLSWNTGAERLFGYAAGEVVGRHFDRFFAPDDARAGRPAEELRQAEAHGQVASENWQVRKDGTRFWANELTTVLRDERGGPHGFAKVMRDTTDRKQLEMELRRQAEELAEANRRKDELLAMLSHELRNPLAPVLNSVQILRHAPRDPAVIQRAGAMIERQVKHMARLIDDLLEVTRATRGTIRLQTERLELGTAVGRAAEAFRQRMCERNIDFVVAPPAAPVWLEADAVRLNQVLTNLLDNAAKYTDPGGRVELAAVREGDRAVVRVRDTGMGIAADLLPRVFDLFSQADRSLDRERGGLGIGLTLVKRLVALHGGEIEARSEGPGRGAEFVVRLPALPEQVAPPRPPGAPDRGSPALRILVVDDNVDTAASLAMLLELYGHEVETANDGTGAVEAARLRAFDAILLDIGLPDLDGYEAARQIRAMAREPRPVLVAISGYGFDADRLRSRGAGFDHHLVKPTDVETITALLPVRGGG